MTIFMVLGIVVALVFLMVTVFNRFAKNRNMVKYGWSNVDVALKRQQDEIENYIKTLRVVRATRCTLRAYVLSRANRDDVRFTMLRLAYDQHVSIGNYLLIIISYLGKRPKQSV